MLIHEPYSWEEKNSICSRTTWPIPARPKQQATHPRGCWELNCLIRPYLWSSLQATKSNQPPWLVSRTNSNASSARGDLFCSFCSGAESNIRRVQTNLAAHRRVCRMGMAGCHQTNARTVTDIPVSRQVSIEEKNTVRHWLNGEFDVLCRRQSFQRPLSMRCQLDPYRNLPCGYGGHAAKYICKYLDITNIDAYHSADNATRNAPATAPCTPSRLTISLLLAPETTIKIPPITNPSTISFNFRPIYCYSKIQGLRRSSPK